MKPLSLRSRALQLLAQREQSRVELRRKLLAHARGKLARAGAGTAAERGRSDAEGAAPDAEVDAVMAWLDANRFLSDQRFAETRVHARAGRFGNLRIRHELAQHAIELTDDAARALAASELQRALDVCARRYPQPPGDAAARARQMRFLTARGFSPETVRQALKRRAARAPAEADPGASTADDDGA